MMQHMWVHEKRCNSYCLCEIACVGVPLPARVVLSTCALEQAGRKAQLVGSQWPCDPHICFQL